MQMVLQLRVLNVGYYFKTAIDGEPQKKLGQKRA